jgi:hypothetical protein
MGIKLYKRVPINLKKLEGYKLYTRGDQQVDQETDSKMK